MIQDADALSTTDARETALACVEAGIEAANPQQVVADAVSVSNRVLHIADAEYNLQQYDEILLVGGGKAAAGVTLALEDVLGDRITGGAIVTEAPAETEHVEVYVGDHPVPSQRGVDGTDRVRELVADAGDRTLILAVITGGASALLPAPADGITLADLQETTDALLASGAHIGELNAVRKHLSALKGGGLARAAGSATVASLVLSDVVGNDLDVIASGPTAPDTSTYADALDVLNRYDIDAPAAVRERLERGAAGEIPETPGEGDPAFDDVRNLILADGFTALDAARGVARERGYDTCILSSRVRGEAREAALTTVAVGEEILATGNPIEPPAVVLSGGETTVTVRGDGDGGPNAEFALAAGIEFAIEGLDDADLALAAVDTDGEDGSSDAAGAIVDGHTVSDAGEARRALGNNDALGYLDGRNAVITTGATGTNVNDLRVLVIEA